MNSWLSHGSLQIACSADEHGKECPATVVTSGEAQLAALRAFLSFDPGYEQLNRRLADEGYLPGYGDLVWSAFEIAVRRRLGHTPAPGDIVKLSASLRVSLRQQQVELDPLAMEDAIRAAIGDGVPVHYDDQTRAEILLFVLGQLIFDENLDDAGLDDFLVMARAMVARRRST